MKKMKFSGMVFVVLLVAMFSGEGAIQAASFSFTSSSGSTSGTGLGNSVVRTDDGVTVTATGWSLSNVATSSFQAGQIQLWGTGMGVCNAGEGTNCGNPQHPVDNLGYTDFLLFTFSKSVELTSAFLTAWASDFDATLWAGTNPLNLDQQTLAGAGLNVGSIESTFNGTASAGSTTRTINLSTSFSNPVDWFLISASINNTYYGDSFKFKTLTVSVPTENAVPEPTTIILLGTGLIGLIAAKRFMKK